MDLSKLDVFKEKTTHQDDYKKFAPLTRGYNYKRPQIEKSQKNPPCANYRDNESRFFWKSGVHVPFNLFWNKKPITEKHPWDPITFVKEIEDLEAKERAIKTRPRLYFSPMIGLDNIDNPETKQLLLQYMYGSEWEKASKEAIKPFKPMPIFPCVAEKKCNPLQLKIDLHPPIKSEICKKAKHWENHQRRADVNPTKAFWLAQECPHKCAGTLRTPITVPDDVRQEIEQLVDADQLRQPHDLLKPKWAGHVQADADDIPLKKPEMPLSNPYVSVAEMVGRRMYGPI